MKPRYFLSLFAVSALLSGTSLAQQNPVMSAEELAKMFGGGASETTAASPKVDAAPAAANVVFSAEELAKILTPTVETDVGKPALRTRGLVTGGQVAETTKPEPGQAGSGVVPNLQINFEFNSADLTDQARGQLDALGQAMNMQQLSSLQFVIGGHTDAKGSSDYNRRLSQQRAESVTRYLQDRHNVSSSRLTPKGHGEESLADPSDPNGWMNRRVEVRTEG